MEQLMGRVTTIERDLIEAREKLAAVCEDVEVNRSILREQTKTLQEQSSSLMRIEHTLDNGLSARIADKLEEHREKKVAEYRAKQEIKDRARNTIIALVGVSFVAIEVLLAIGVIGG